MEKEKRLNLYRSKLTEIEGKKEGFVTFRSPEMAKKIIQFASSEEPGFIADIPLHGHGFTEDEIVKMKKLGLRESFGDELNVITKIPRVGLSKAAILIQHFGGLEGIARASEHDLQKVPGIGEKLSRAVVSFQPWLRMHISEVRAEKDYILVKECDLAGAVDLTRRFFEEVCNLPKDHGVSVKVEVWTRIK